MASHSKRALRAQTGSLPPRNLRDTSERFGTAKRRIDNRALNYGPARGPGRRNRHRDRRLSTQNRPETRKLLFTDPARQLDGGITLELEVDAALLVDHLGVEAAALAGPDDGAKAAAGAFAVAAPHHSRDFQRQRHLARLDDLPQARGLEAELDQARLHEGREVAWTVIGGKLGG